MRISVPLAYNDLRVVQIIADGEKIVEIRVPDVEGVEHVIAQFYSIEDAVAAAEKFGNLSPDAIVAAVALTQIIGLAGRISVATDDAGTGMYATKAHMRAWAKQMLTASSDVLDVLSKRGNANASKQ